MPIKLMVVLPCKESKQLRILNCYQLQRNNKAAAYVILAISSVDNFKYFHKKFIGFFGKTDRFVSIQYNKACEP